MKTIHFLRKRGPKDDLLWDSEGEHTRCGKVVPKKQIGSKKSEVTCCSCLESHSAPIRKAMKR